MAGSIPSIPSPPRDQGNILRWCSELWRYLFKSRIIVGAGLREVQTGSGRIISTSGGSGSASDSDHPFKIHATVEPELGVSIIVTVSNGSIDGKSPLFKGETGDPISDSPSPSYTFAPSAGTYYVYLVVTVDKNGFLADDQDVWIEIPSLANDPIPDDVAPVPDDMPAAGDTGTAGLIHIQIGYVVVAVVEDVITVSTWNDLRQNVTFWMCDDGYSIRPIS